jgi:hypothetical protein
MSDEVAESSMQWPITILILMACAVTTAAICLTVYRYSRSSRLLNITLWLIQLASVLGLIYPFEVNSTQIPSSIFIFPANLIVLYLAYLKKAFFDFRITVLHGIFYPQMVIAFAILLGSLFLPNDSLFGRAVFQSSTCVCIVAGFLYLLVDILIIVVVSDNVSSRCSRFTHAFWPILLALLLDALLITVTLSLLDGEVYKDFWSLLAIQVLGKFTAAFVYAVAIWFYSWRFERDLLTFESVRPHGIEFLEATALQSANSLVFPKRPLEVVNADSPQAFFQLTEALLGLAYMEEATPVGLYLFKTEQGAPSSADCLRRITKGRFNGCCYQFQESFILVVHGAEKERLATLSHELRDCFPGVVPTVRVYPEGDEEAGDRHSAGFIVNDYLSDLERKEFATFRDLKRRELLIESYEEIIRRWPELDAKYHDLYVAFSGKTFLGADVTSHFLYHRFVTQERPMRMIVDTRIDSEAREFILEQLKNANNPETPEGVETVGVD